MTTLSNAPAPAETVREIVARALAPKAWASEVGYAQENRRKASLKHADAALAAIAAHGLALVPVEPSDEQLDRAAWLHNNDCYEAMIQYLSGLAAAPLSPPVGAWRPISEAPKTDPATMIARPFLGWCPDQTAPDGGDQRVCWWEPRMKGGVWYADRDLEEHPTYWQPLPPPPIDVKAEGET